MQRSRISVQSPLVMKWSSVRWENAAVRIVHLGTSLSTACEERERADLPPARADVPRAHGEVLTHPALGRGVSRPSVPQREDPDVRDNDGAEDAARRDALDACVQVGEALRTPSHVQTDGCEQPVVPRARLAVVLHRSPARVAGAARIGRWRIEAEERR
jgi:hypothetical protein